MATLDYFKNLKDFEELQPYLDLENDDFEAKFAENSFTPDFSCAIIVDGLPIVNPDKRAKLVGVLMNIYTQFASYLVQDDVVMPSDAAGSSFGFCFVLFRNKSDAATALASTQGFVLGKNTFKVSLYSDIELYETKSESMESKSIDRLIPPDPTSWLCDAAGRDQFVLRHGKETEILWASASAGEEPIMVYDGNREKEGGRVWCERQVSWSPMGTYLVTFHAPGIKLWGGAEFASSSKFLHANVEQMEFSPCERYVVTYSSNPSLKQQEAENIIVWSVQTGEKLRSFTYKNALDVKMHVQVSLSEEVKGKRVDRVFRGKIASFNERDNEYSIQEGAVTHNKVKPEAIQALQNPNILKWSYDGKYVARLGVDSITVYELPSMQLLDKKSFACKDILSFAWSPKRSSFSYWTPASGNYPAMVNIVEVPSRAEICSRKCFDVLEGHMLWQSEGDFLCAYMTKQQGKKRTYVVMFFRVREPNIPVELIELNEPIVHVSWEPSGERVAIVSGECKNCTVSFYSLIGPANPPAVKKGSPIPKQELTLLHSINDTQCTEVVWSPAGGVCAIAFSIVGDSCAFQLFDIDNTSVLASRRHERCTGLFWDPSGRVLASVTTSPLVIGGNVRAAPLQIEDMFNLWTFQGNPICTVRKEKLYKFMWRPRPNNLLSAEEKKAVVKNIKKYEKMFEKEDKARKHELYQEATSKRNAIADAFLSRLASIKREYNDLYGGKSWKVVVRDGYDSDDDSNYEICYKKEETIVSTKEQIVTH